MVDTPTTSALDHLLSSLDSDPDIAAEKYETLRQKITKLMCWKGCPESRADALADQTLDRIGEKLAQGEAIRNIASYAAGVARFVHLEYVRRSKDDAVGDDLPEVAVAPDVPVLDDEDGRMRCLRKCLGEVAPADADRNLIVAYYDAEGKNKDNRRRLAESLGLTANALKVRACRLRAKLERCINDCVWGVTEPALRATTPRGGDS